MCRESSGGRKLEGGEGWENYMSGTKGGFPGGSVVKNLPAVQETQVTRVGSLGQEDALEKEMATHSSILAWRISWKQAGQATVHRITKSRTRLK